MHRFFSLVLAISVGTFLFGTSAAFAQHHHEGDFVIGQSGAPTFEIHVHGDPDILSGAEPIPLYPGEGAFEGFFVADDPGWIGLEEDEPDEGMYLLLAGHQVSLKRISFDPGFSMFDPTAGPILENNGSTFLFPLDEEGFIHRHLIFAGEGEIGDTWWATFQLVDPSGLHAASDTFTLQFVAMPEPTSLLLLVSGLAVVSLRRRAARA